MSLPDKKTGILNILPIEQHRQVALLVCEGMPLQEACKAAGYANPRGAAYRLGGNPLFREALGLLADYYLRLEMLPMAKSVMKELMRPDQPTKIRFAAAKFVWEMAEPPQPNKIKDLGEKTLAEMTQGELMEVMREAERELRQPATIDGEAQEAIDIKELSDQSDH